MKYPEIVSSLTLEEKIRMVTGDGAWHTYTVDRLGVEGIMMTDGPIGLRKVDEASNKTYISVAFPSGCLTACSFDRELLRQMGDTIGKECQSYDVGMILGPAINIKRSPLCGRNFEYLSEDPYLTGELAASYINGVQSNNVGTSLKHYAANSQEYRRMSYDAKISERALREIYLAGFETAVKKSQPYTLMCSYNKINGTHASENKWLLTDVLRDEWGFEGAVISDWGAVNYRDRALKAGLDLEMPGNNIANKDFILKALADGSLTMAELDTAVDRVIDLSRKCSAGKKEVPFDFEKDHETAARIAEGSMVLLKNDGRILPLKKETKVALLGEFAVRPRIQGGGSAFINTYKVDSILECMQAYGNVEYTKGFEIDDDTVKEDLIEDALRLCASCDTAVVIAGLPDNYESEGYDRKHMHMPSNQLALISALAKAGIPTVIVLQNGAAVEMPWADDVSGILEAYLGGEAAGTAIANILYGKVNPSGKLAESVPFQLEDNPSFLNFPGNGYEVNYAEDIYVGYRYYDKKKMAVRYPFGYGLSYTTFEYSDLKTEAVEDPSNLIKVSLKVKNTGDVFGKEIVQLYVGDVSDKAGRADRPAKELKGFEKVSLEAGEEKTVEFLLDERAFSYYEEKIGGWMIPTAEYSIMVGSSSRDIRLEKTIYLDLGQSIPLHITQNTTFGELLRDERTRQYTIDNLMGKKASGILSFGIEAATAMMDHNPIRGLRNFSNEKPERVDEIIYELKQLSDDE